MDVTKWTCLKIKHMHSHIEDSQESTPSLLLTLDRPTQPHDKPDFIILRMSWQWLAKWSRSSWFVWMAWPRVIFLYRTAHDCFRKCVGKCYSWSLTTNIEWCHWLHAGWRTHLVVTSIIWPRAQLWCLSELTMQLVPIKWKEALKDCNPTTSSSGKHLWSSKKSVQGLHKAGRRIQVGLFWGLQALDNIPQERWGTQQATRYGGGGTSAPAFTSPLVSSSLSLALQSDF